MVTHLLSVDPGVSTGVTLWIVPDDTPARRVGAWQFGGGLGGFMDWRQSTGDWAERVGLWDLHVLSEKFTPLQGKGFSLTLEAVEPLRIEGAMVALDMLPDYAPKSTHWQRPSEMYWAGGKDLAERKKLSRRWLKEHDLLVPAKELGAPDNNDFVSSSLHALAWLRKHHRPTLEHYWREQDG